MRVVGILHTETAQSTFRTAVIKVANDVKDLQNVTQSCIGSQLLFGYLQNLCVLSENLVRMIRLDAGANIRRSGIVEGFDQGAGERLKVTDWNEPTPAPILEDLARACGAVGADDG